MGAKNSFVKNNLPVICQRQMLDVIIFTWIDAQRFTLPTISVEESAKSFLAHHKIDEGELSLDKIRKTYYRILNDLIDEQKTINKKN
jgi:hypothetical protein